MSRSLTTLLLVSLFFAALGWILFIAKFENSGDIIEYYGMTETLINHSGLGLTPADQTSLSNTLSPNYFLEPGWYLPGLLGNRYPVHFFFYSFLILPVRLGLNAIRITTPTTILAATNLIIYFFSSLYIFRLLNQVKTQLLWLVFSLTSPLLFYFGWPGPDMLYLCLATIGAIHFLKKQTWQASLFFAIASWHSQPLVILSLLTLLYHSYHHLLKNLPQLMLEVFCISCLIVLPYITNLYFFATLTPWTILPDAWTKLHGFGPQNISLQKSLETFLDPNIGLAWYAPLLLILGLVTLFHKPSRSTILLLVFFLITSIFYQSNPGWHYGMAGFGPTRHIIFFLGFLFALVLAHPPKMASISLGLLLLVQFFPLKLNSFAQPLFSNTNQLTPVASYLLDNYPSLYNPTPEIFVDRTTHADLPYPSSAVYKLAGVCQKAYILSSEPEGKLAKLCPNLRPSKTQVALDGTYYNFQ